MGLDACVRLTLGDLELDVTLRARDGETVAVLGPNGAGKTTLLRALAGLVPIADGHVTIDDVVVDDPARDVYVEPERRSVGLVFQNYLLFPHLTVLENVAFGLRSQRVGRADARERARTWLARVAMGEYAGARPGTLSGGQQQRVALARALVTEPRLVLLDEPLAALDVGTRTELRRDLRAELTSFAGARVIVTHELLDAVALADRLVVLERGSVAQEGTVAEVTERPRTRYVADLVGVNLLRGRADGRTVVLGGGGSLVIADDEHGEVYVSVDPRAVSLHRHAPEGSARNVWRGRIAGADLLGDRVRLHVASEVPLVAEVTAAAVADLGLTDGVEVWAAVKATEVSVYPA